jgi:CRP-like cAMP-binding protein
MHCCTAEALVERLKTIRLFQSLDMDHLVDLVRTAVCRQYAAGTVIFLEGDLPSPLGYVEFGWLKVVKISPEGREQILCLLEPGDIFNIMDALIHRPIPATFVAMETTGVWLIERQRVHQILTASPDVALAAIETMGDRIAMLVQPVEDLSLHTIDERLARLLLTRSDERGVVRRRHWATQAEMAAELGTVPTVFNRSLHKLTDAGIVTTARNQIQDLDREMLAGYGQNRNR